MLATAGVFLGDARVSEDGSRRIEAVLGDPQVQDCRRPCCRLRPAPQPGAPPQRVRHGGRLLRLVLRIVFGRPAAGRSPGGGASRFRRGRLCHSGGRRSTVTVGLGGVGAGAGFCLALDLVRRGLQWLGRASMAQGDFAQAADSTGWQGLVLRTATAGAGLALDGVGERAGASTTPGGGVFPKAPRFSPVCTTRRADAGPPNLGWLTAGEATPFRPGGVCRKRWTSGGAGSETRHALTSPAAGAALLLGDRSGAGALGCAGARSTKPACAWK